MIAFPEQHRKSGEVENARVIDYFCPSSPIPPLTIVRTPKTPLGEGRCEDEINCVYGETEGNAPCDSCHKGVRSMSPYCPCVHEVSPAHNVLNIQFNYQIQGRIQGGT